MVKPTQDTPMEVITLSDIDQAIALTHVLTVYFYQPNSHWFQQNAVKTLKESLSKALVPFYPLAGRLQPTAAGDRLELNCNSAGALFVEAESEATIEDFGDFPPNEQMRQLAPQVDYQQPIHELPLLLVQVTRFKCGGICMGWGMSHVIADAKSAAHFLSEWTRIARGEPLENLPIFDRSCLIPGEPLPSSCFDHLELSPNPVLIGQSDIEEERKKETVVEVFKLTAEQVEKLKNKANKDPTRHNSERPFTRYEAVAGHMWRCACIVRGHKSEQMTRLRIPVDFRNRVEPPLPPWYFGNVAFPAAAMATAGELMSKPLAFACGTIREAVENVKNDYIKSFLVSLRKERDLSKFRYSHVVGSSCAVFPGNPNMHITSWMTITLRGTDFGWGKEVYFGPVALGYDGKSYILSGRDEPDSLAVALRLQVAHMNAFKKLFYESI
ncbi:hypothetical protein NMG60_11015095 [Bertholletia excelsa]